MDTIIQDMFRWSIGFVVVSTVYLTLVWWLGRKLRANRQRRAATRAGEPAATSAAKPALESTAESADERSE
ncbi:MAG: hypothetical protein KJ000_35315 [Pirellulaceae bacterium]|nr:hypothetical protein [Pirellulaceae bacterium]